MALSQFDETLRRFDGLGLTSAPGPASAVAGNDRRSSNSNNVSSNNGSSRRHLVGGYEHSYSSQRCADGASSFSRYPEGAATRTHHDLPHGGTCAQTNLNPGGDAAVRWPRKQGPGSDDIDDEVTHRHERLRSASPTTKCVASKLSADDLEQGFMAACVQPVSMMMSAGVARLTQHCLGRYDVAGGPPAGVAGTAFGGGMGGGAGGPKLVRLQAAEGPAPHEWYGHLSANRLADGDAELSGGSGRRHGNRRERIDTDADAVDRDAGQRARWEEQEEGGRHCATLAEDDLDDLADDDGVEETDSAPLHRQQWRRPGTAAAMRVRVCPCMAYIIV